MKKLREKSNQKQVMINLAKITSDLRNLSETMELQMSKKMTEAIAKPKKG